jgi:hypothetical protein
VQRRSTSAKHIVIHARQIIMDERVRVYKFYTARDSCCVLCPATGRLEGSHQQERPDPLSLSEHRIADRRCSSLGYTTQQIVKQTR